MKTLLTSSTWLLLLACLAMPPSSVRALDDLIITEFMAENDGTVEDEDGDTPDWIEIYNSGTNGVNLNGWYLTDTAGDLTRWRFPATNLPVNTFLLVYASNKDRRTPGKPLHTNFRLDNDAGYIALVKPDGVTVQSSIDSYAQQVAGVSYGLPVTRTSTTLISNGSPARFTVPLNDSLGITWTAKGFNDSSWVSVMNGVGFEGGGTPSVGGVQLADSVTDFSGTQGLANWYYGYWDKKADSNGTYETADFTEFPRGTGNILAPTNYWDGTKWDWPAGNPPWTELTSTGGHPAGENGEPTRAIHWAVRRYVSEADGPLRLSGVLACSGSSGTCGDGVIGRILVDGVEVWEQTAFNFSAGYSLIVSASVGSKIDFVIDSGAANYDTCDTTTFTATVRTAGDLAVVADSASDWSYSGTQGDKNWYYGLYNRSIDNNANYEATNFIAFPSGSGPHSTANFWNGAAWQWFDGDPPFDTLGQYEVLPSIFPTGGTNGQDHRIVRRWVSEVSGPVVIDWHVSKKGLGGGGVTATLFQNNINRVSAAVTGTDFAGTTRSTSLTVAAGDTLDFMIEPGPDMQNDLTFFNATIYAATSLSNQFTSDVGALMTNINSSAYLRIPFTIDEPSQIDSLRLVVRSDDGYIAYLNGVEIASSNAPVTPAWNSAANSPRADATAIQGEQLNLDSVRDLLTAGQNVLAFHALNASAADQDFLLQVELVAGIATVNPSGKRYFAAPTPGSINGPGTTVLGPLIANVDHVPKEPSDIEDLYVTAKVAPTFNPLADVRLFYRVMFGAESSLVMRDDGLNGDGLPGDGVYGAVIPNAAYTSGQMIRYYITATDSSNLMTRLPPIGDTNNSPLYLGTVVKDPSLTNPLPVLHWFIQNLNNIDGSSSVSAKAQIYFLGQFYDNVSFSRHGQSSSGFRMKSYNVDFNPGHLFRYAEGKARVDDINLLQTYTDKSHMRNILAYGMHGDTGWRSPTHYVVPVRVQSNAVFHGIMNIVEKGDANYIERIGRDPNGAFYKIYDAGTAAVGSAEKKTRRYEDKTDLQTLVTVTSAGDSADRRKFLYDSVDISEVIDYLSAMALSHNHDCCHKNYYYYRDTEGDGEWEMLPWDVDLSFGRNWQSGETYFDDRTYTNNRVVIGGENSTLINAMCGLSTDNASGTPAIRQMMLRRFRTLMDTLLQSNSVPVTNRKIETHMDELLALHAPDAALTLAKWGSWGGGAQNIFDTNSAFYKTITQAANEIRTLHLPPRRALLYAKNSAVPGANFLPDAQPTNINITIGAIEFNPASGNQAEEYIQLVNTNTIFVDISGWKLTGAVDHVFQGGVVIPPLGPSNFVYVVPDKKAFRNRVASPHGQQQLYVEGPYKGQLSARGETIVLLDTVGRVVTTNLYPGAPSGPQRWLRITEIMYHPAAPPFGSLYEAEDYEYIELRNTGPTNISLVGVHFTNGIDFTFTGSAVTDLAPGGYVLVVRNTAAFTSRYGANPNVAGAYVGILDNGGENIRLDDAVGEKILDFRYENKWYPVTDGPGASLVIIDPGADWKTWNFKESWRPSAFDLGSPAASDPPTNSYLPILVAEVISHSDPPLKDAIKLFNPNGIAVNIGGWYISDDLGTPRKFRIPNNTSIPAGGYLTFDEPQFNPTPGTPPSFAFSSLGDEAYVFSGNGTNITGWFDGQRFGAAENGISFGRYTNSQTNVHFVALSTTNLSGPNALPKVGPIVVSEILYHPPDLAIFGDNSQDEFIELANITGAPVPLFDPAHHTNTWRVRGGVSFDCPTNVTLPAGGYAVLVSFYPTNSAAAGLFRDKFSVPANVPLLGPFHGKLDNSAESVQLYKPDAPLGGEVPYVLVEQIDYTDQAPWPLAADGFGGSLQRRLPTAYGNDPTNWAGAPATGGTGFVGGNPPVLTTPPANTSVLLGGTAMFSVSVSGTPPFAYQWQFNSNNIPGANSPTYTKFSVQYSDAGAYRVIILGAGGSIESPNAQLTVLVPPAISLQPANVFLRVPPDTAAQANRGATFRVTASTANPPLNYQWRFNGTNIPLGTPDYVGINSSNLVVTNVVFSQAGVYSCAVTDGNGTIASADAVLGVLPFMISASQPMTVPEGADISVSAVVQASPTPFLYSWRRGTPINTNIVSNLGTNFATWNSTVAGYVLINNILSSNYSLRLVFTNLGTGPNGVALINNNAFFTIVADTDGDGIPNTVEASLGLDPMLAADGDGDLDGDGMSNADEFRAGTDPANPASNLRVDLSTVPGQATVRFGAVSNRTYTVQYTDSLPAPFWSRLADVLALSSNRMESFVDPTWTTNRVYQVVTPRQP